MAKVRFGIVGAGAIARAYAQAFQSCDEAEVVGVSDVRDDAAKALADSLGAKAFTCHREMADRTSPEAVLISTPPASHPEICLDFIARRVPVLCEKPFAVSVKDTLEVLDAAEKGRVTITMASKFRYVPDVAEAKRIVDSGELGDVVLFENAFASRVDMSSRWNSDPAVGGGGVLIDNGTHSLDLARHFLGPLAKVLAVEGARQPGLRVEDTVTVFVRSERGVIGTIDLSWTINKELDRYVSLFGTRGAVVVGWKQSRFRRLDAPEWTVIGNGYDKVGAFRAQLDNFARAVRGQEEPLVGAKDILGSVRVVEAAYESLRRNYWTSVDSELPART